jgi:hypothetical protein
MVKKEKKTKIDLKEASPYSDIRKSLKDKEIFIKKIFETVLGRDASSRELSFYKYGEMEEEDIFKELLEGEEHKKIVDDAKGNEKLERRIEILRNEREKFEGLINDKALEYRELTKLLRSKNEEIKKLRETDKNIYNQEKIIKQDSVEKILPGYSFEYDQSYSQVTPTRVSIKHKKDIFDKIRDILKLE